MRTIVFFGDSITNGYSDIHPPLGTGYVSILQDMFYGNEHFKESMLINSGINGNTVEDLLQRYSQDVVAHQPDVVVTKIGINDAYHYHMSGYEDETRLQAYNSGLKQLLGLLHKDLPRVQLFLFTPYYISDLKTDNLYMTMDKYCRVVKKLGAIMNIPVLDIQAIFDQAIITKPAKEWAEDQIHPSIEGHTLIAEAACRFLQQYLIKQRDQ